VKLTAHLQLVPRSRKCGSIHPLPHTPSWHSAELVKHRDNFTFVPYGIRSVCLNEEYYLKKCENKTQGRVLHLSGTKGQGDGGG
jgi:hypothetical protein